MVFTPPVGSNPRDRSRELLETSYSRRSLVHLPAGSNVPLLRQHVWVVIRGMVKLNSVTMQGDEVLLGLAGPNEPFGDPLSNTEAYQAITLMASDLLCLSWEEISASPHLAMTLLEGMAARYRQSEAWLGLLGLRPIEDRVRGFLELMAADHGQPCEQGLRLPLKLTHQEIASALSTTRVTVTRVLGQLREQGWLRLDSQRHLVIAHEPLSR